jgi:hypothetical protein
MRRCLITCVVLLSGCMEAAERPVPLDLLQPEVGWQGPVPTTEGMLIDALVAEKHGRERANQKLCAVGEVTVGKCFAQPNR